MNIEIKNGEYIVGVLKELITEPWSNDSTKFNHRLILVSPYIDNYGNNQTDVNRVDVLPDDLQNFKDQVNKFKDKKVIVPCVNRARSGGRKGAWLSKFVPKGSSIQEIK